MEASFSVDSMIREVKTNLNKYEALLKNMESHPTEKTVKDVEKIKSTLDNNIKMVQPIIVKEEHKFLLNSYKELKDELNKRYVIIKKNQANKSDKEKLNELLSNKSNVENKNIDLLIDGAFEADKVDYSRPWCGSTNQRYHFLTNRYNEEIFEKYKNKIEINISKNGTIFMNGMGNFDEIQHKIDLIKII